MSTLNTHLVSPSSEIRIRPNGSWLQFDWRGIWNYRDLLLLLVRRDFVAKYRQTVLGPLWFIIQPLVTTAVFTLLFGTVLQVSTDGTPPILFYLCGLLGWNYFSQIVGSTGNTLAGNAHLFTKVYFPRLIVPFSAVLSNLTTFAIQMATFLAVYAHFCFFAPGTMGRIEWTALTLPLFLLQTAALALGVGLWISALSAKYRDFQHLAGFLLQLWMYATPVIYPLSQIPERWRCLVVLNPMTTVVEAFKRSFLGSGTVELTHVLLSVFVTAVVFISGLFVFNKVERTFADTV